MYKKTKVINVSNDLHFNILYDNVLNNNIKLGDFNKIDYTKNKIETVNQKDWARIRKYTNIYESPSKGTYKKPISRAFYKLWELLFDYDIKCNSETLHLCEAPGGFIQAMLEYKYKKNIHIQKCYTMSLRDNTNVDVPKYNSEIQYNKNVKIIKNCNGDLYYIDNILFLVKTLENTSIKFISSDGGINDNGDFNNKEVSHIRLILSEIVTALLILDLDGDFIIKIFDIFTDSTCHIIFILSYLFDDVYITKPLTSRPTNSEKYLVCKKFRKNKFTVNIRNKLISILIELSNSSKLLTNILKNIPSDFINQLYNYNNSFVNNQIKSIENNLKILNNEQFISHYDFVNKKNRHSKNWLIKYKLI